MGAERNLASRSVAGLCVTWLAVETPSPAVEIGRAKIFFLVIQRSLLRARRRHLWPDITYICQPRSCSI
jgi:hypothetical protein